MRLANVFTVNTISIQLNLLLPMTIMKTMKTMKKPSKATPSKEARVPISVSKKHFTGIEELAEVFGVSPDTCLEILLERFVFDPLDNEVLADEVKAIICSSRSEAETLADRLEAFAIKAKKSNPTERLIRASAVEHKDGWGVKTVLNRA
jgi:hypothetical protein